MEGGDSSGQQTQKKFGGAPMLMITPGDSQRQQLSSSWCWKTVPSVLFLCPPACKCRELCEVMCSCQTWMGAVCGVGGRINNAVWGFRVK